MNSSSSWLSPLLSETESGARHRYSHQWKRHRKVTEEIMNDNKLPTCYPWGPLGCSRQKSVKIFQECRQSESSGACRWRLRTTAKDPQLFTISLRGSRGVCEHVCVWEVSTCACGRCARVCVCVWGGGQQNTTSLLLLRVSNSHHVPGDSASGAALWATSRLQPPPPAVTICTNRDLPKPSPAHTSSQNIRTSHQLTLDVKTRFTAKERDISVPHCHGAGIIHTQWSRTPKPHSTPGTGTQWQKGLLSSLMVERWRGPSARR